MRTLLIVLFFLTAPGLALGFQSNLDPEAKDGSVKHRFADFGFLPPASSYEGRVFRLSQDYPPQPPPAEKIPAFCRGPMDDLRSNWKKFLLDVRAYCFEGNVRGGDIEDDFVLESGKAKWYHMPWQHYGPNGREGIHGLTKEAPVSPRQLAWSQTYGSGQTYAVGFYNDFGGYTIWQVWREVDRPHIPNGGIRFPVGTVVFKLLFTDVPVGQVPFLNPPLQWQAYATKDFLSSDREIKDFSLIQMDIMVRQENAPSGWVFGTYQYNGKLGSKTLWENLVPVGVQWGNDPEVKDNASNPQPIQTVINRSLRESIINPDDRELPPSHLGWNGRLNGPVDNPMSSCMSCHMTASMPQRYEISPLFEKNPPEPGSESWMRWFRNLKCGESFDGRPAPTDFSLQLAASLQNYYAWHNQSWKLRAADYPSAKVRARIKPLPADYRVTHPEPNHDENLPPVEIRRDYRPPK